MDVDKQHQTKAPLAPSIESSDGSMALTQGAPHRKTGGDVWGGQEFSIDRWGSSCPKSAKPKFTERAKVTIAIGMICKSRERGPLIVLASDSQTTGPGHWKCADTQKVHVVEFADDRVIVAQSGVADMGERVIQIMERKAKDRELKNEETAVKTAEEALREVRISLLKDFIESEEGKRRYCIENDIDLLVGCFVGGKPFLHTVDLSRCTPTRVTKAYGSIGVGGAIADFLLREYQEADPEFRNDVAIAASVVETTIDNMNGCGRPTWIALAFPLSEDRVEQRERMRQGMKASGRDISAFPSYRTECCLMGKADMELLIAEIKESELKSSEDKKKWIVGVLERFGQKRRERGLADMLAEDKRLEAYAIPTPTKASKKTRLKTPRTIDKSLR